MPADVPAWVFVEFVALGFADVSLVPAAIAGAASSPITHAEASNDAFSI